MNKKELAQIKKAFSEGCGYFTLNKILKAFVDAENNVKYIEAVPYHELGDAECEVLMESLKKSLSGTLGKNLMEFQFPEESYEEDGAQSLLYNALCDKLETEDKYKPLVDRIAQNAGFSEPFAILMGYCSYSIMIKDKNDMNIGESNKQYNFLITSLCPASTSDDGLYYDNDKAVISKKNNTELIIGKAPTDGFLFPCFSENCADIHHVMYYSKSAKKPKVSVIEDVLDCHFEMSAQGEKECFHAVLTAVCREELNYNTITRVNDIVTDIVAQNKNETQPPVVDSARMRTILYDVGISEDKIQSLDAVYEKAVGKASLKASNLVDTKTVLSTQDITVNIGKDAVNKVRTAVIQGRSCLLIDLDDSVTVNGIEASFDIPKTAVEV
ncbi:MAG: DUF4317 domain-containing protein [Oscillospiraceae bacterium]|nr:DUF4317 domain-containing protein [Oscillospiraceae bacterium]